MNEYLKLEYNVPAMESRIGETNLQTGFFLSSKFVDFLIRLTKRA